VFRDGVETMIVESTAEYEGQEAGWIVPVPSQPIAVKAETSDGLTTLAEMCQPNVVGDDEGVSAMQRGGLALLVMIVLGLWLAAGSEHSSAAIRLLASMALAILVLSFAVGACLLPALGTAGAGPGAGVGVDVNNLGRIGSYNVRVINGASSDKDLDQWLDANQFVAGEPAKQVLAEYLASGWSLIAAKLIQGERATHLTPHPLSIVFSTKWPVYPMRLTGLTDDPLALDLFVLADERAHVAGLNCWYAQSCAMKSRRFGASYFDEPYFEDARLRPVLYPEERTAIGHPMIAERSWDGCVITRLHGELEPDEMQDDFDIEFRGVATHRATVYTEAAAWGYAGAFALTGFGILALTAGVIRNMRGNTSGEPRQSATRVIVVGSLILVSSVGYGVSREIVVAEEGSRFGYWRYSHPDACWIILEEIEQWYPGPDVAAIEGIITEQYWPRVTEGDHPIGFTFERCDDAALLVLYDAAAIPYAVLINAETGTIIERDVDVDAFDAIQANA